MESNVREQKKRLKKKEFDHIKIEKWRSWKKERKREIQKAKIRKIQNFLKEWTTGMIENKKQLSKDLQKWLFPLVDNILPILNKLCI